MRIIMLRLTILLLALMLMLPHRAGAFWGFGGGGTEEKIGLDLKQGYDVNTVVTVTGRVASLPRGTEQKNVLVELKTAEETVYLSVGPANFWEKSGTALNVNDEVMVKGARAQGKDGRQYLLAQKLTNRSTGGQVEMRDQQGTPLWTGRAAFSGRPDLPAWRGVEGGPMRGPDMMRGAPMRDFMRGGGMRR